MTLPNASTVLTTFTPSSNPFDPPPSPKDVVDKTNEQVTKLVTNVVAHLGAVGAAVEGAGSAFNTGADAFSAIATKGFADIQAAIRQTMADIQRDGTDALLKVHDLAAKVTGLDLDLSLILVNGKGIELHPDVLYRTVRDLIDPAKPRETVTIQFRAPLNAPLAPLAVDSAALHHSLRAVVLPVLGLPSNSAVLNSDPVTITVLICLTLMVLGLPLVGGASLAMSGLFVALGVVLIIAAIQGRTISVDTCPSMEIGGGVVDANVRVPFAMCTALKIS